MMREKTAKKVDWTQHGSYAIRRQPYFHFIVGVRSLISSHLARTIHLTVQQSFCTKRRRGTTRTIRPRALVLLVCFSSMSSRPTYPSVQADCSSTTFWIEIVIPEQWLIVIESKILSNYVVPAAILADLLAAEF